ncbi:MAG: SMP-30/gluconolactonase/LRE family protein, partial [Opitutales bacterium]|nr:SMP-30/gluconolactonase/LRE family protein [Opitutales bacterium]
MSRKKFIKAFPVILTSKYQHARDWSGAAPTRYPDPDVIVLNPAFAKYRLGNASIRRIHTSPDMLWAEGPAWSS